MPIIEHGLSDLLVLANLPQLQQLDLFGYNQLTDISPLASLTQLRDPPWVGVRS